MSRTRRYWSLDAQGCPFLYEELLESDIREDFREEFGDASTELSMPSVNWSGFWALREGRTRFTYGTDDKQKLNKRRIGKTTLEILRSIRETHDERARRVREAGARLVREAERRAREEELRTVQEVEQRITNQERFERAERFRSMRVLLKVIEWARYRVFERAMFLISKSDARYTNCSAIAAGMIRKKEVLILTPAEVFASRKELWF